MFAGTEERHLTLHREHDRAAGYGRVMPVQGLSRRELGKLVAAIGVGMFASVTQRAWAESCALPARNPIEGPYFLGDPEERSQTGKGLLISGVIRDAVTCQPIPGARLVRWHANQYGIYEEYYRALSVVRSDGTYQLESIPPGQYANLDPHVHFYVTADGYQPVIAQAQWRKGSVIPGNSTFDFSLVKR